MKNYKFLIFIIISAVMLIHMSSYGQNKLIRGTVKGIHNEGEHNDTEPLAFANVYWVNTTSGVSTDINGKFVITKPEKDDLKLVVSYVGFKSDTISVAPNQNQLNIVLKPNSELSEVVIKDENGNYISKIKPIKTEVITTDGLQKLACCNLSESFEGTATVDVGYSDAVSGAKRIQMLGLSGIYSQLLTENMPAVRGLSSAYGLSFIPGSWMQSIQISKGTSSVINGYESITGQINVEYKKPEHTSDRLFINLYGNSDTRAEANIISSHKINDNWSTMILANGAYNGLRIDHNMDSFLDIPTGWSANILNRWSYEKAGKMHMQFGINVLEDKKFGGQTDYYNAGETEKQKFYHIGIENRHYTAFLKSGFYFGHEPYKSLGIVATGNRHEMYSDFGLNSYKGIQNSGYLNLIYQSVFGNTNHKFSTGASFMYDDYNESLNDSAFKRVEYVPGGFFEYTYTYPEKLSVILGFRADYNSHYGTFITPRIHLKWNVTDLFVIRASAGRGYRTANIIAENTSVLASSRTRFIAGDLKPEIAWNYGLNFTKEFLITEKRKASIGMDFYRTDFENQVIIDFDKDPQQVLFYNLDGRSYSNSVQLDGMIQPFDGFEITLAGRYNYVMKTINGAFVESPYSSRFKGLLTLSYATRFDKWKFDVTSQFNGKMRLPSTETNPEAYRRDNYSKPYFMLYAQITKKFKRIDIYAGVENITNYRQPNPIIAADDAFGTYFDASMIWGPIMGRTVYAGLRLTIK